MFAKFVAKYLSYGVGRMLRETGLGIYIPIKVQLSTPMAVIYRGI